MPGETSHDPDRLLAQAGWVRELARSLVADAHLADDLAQDTLVAALESPPRESEKLRPWLATVLKNFLRQFARKEGRRRVREDWIAARERLDPTPPSPVEQVAAHRELSEAVLALPEPYRTAIAMRYFEELPPREIARRRHLPVATVQSQLHRGLAKLRERLERGHPEDRRAWMAFLLPLCVKPEGLLPPSLGVLAVNVKLACAIVSVAAVGTLAAVAVFGTGRDGGVQPEANAALAAAPAADLASAPAQPEPLPVALRADRESVPLLSAPRAPAASAPVPAGEAAPEAVARLVRGRVFDAEGGPAPGVEVLVRGQEDQAPVLSQAGGWFELTTFASEGRLVADGEEWMTVVEGAFRASLGIEPVIVIARSMELGGQVLDENLQPLSGARLTVDLPDGFLARFDVPLEASQNTDWRELSDRTGSFRLERVPAVEGLLLSAVLDGYVPRRVELPPTTDLERVITLARPAQSVEGAVRGVVIDPDGLPVAGARVALGLASTVSREDGSFDVTLKRAVTFEQIRAIKEGFLPGVLERPYGADGANGGWPDRVEVQLPAPALSLKGTVVDHEGRPVPGVRVWLDDPTPFGNVGLVPVQLENLMAGAEVPSMVTESELDLPEDDGDGNNFRDYWTDAGRSTALWHWVPTSADGSFDLGGLTDRGYRLKIMNDETLQVHVTEPIRAGREGVRVELPEPALWERATVRVLGPGGVPVPDINVRVRHKAFGTRGRVPGGTTELAFIQTRESARTGADGGVTFENLPQVDLMLDLRGDTIVPTTQTIAAGTNPDGLLIEVRVRCRVEVLRSDPESKVDSFAFRDEEGRVQDVLVLRDGSVNAFTSQPLTEGRSGVVSVSSAAVELVLFEDGVEVGSVPLRLKTDEVNQIRF